MRVLQFLWRLSPQGGIPRVVRDLACGIDDTLVDLHICTARPHYDEDLLDELPAHVTLHTLDIEGSPGPAARARMAWQLTALTRRLRPEILHVHSGTSWYASAAASLVPRSGRILEVHDTPQSQRYSTSNARSMHVLVDRLGFGLVTHSRSVGDDLRAAWGVGPDRITCIPLCIADPGDVSGPMRAAARLELGLSSDTPVVLYVARLVDSKRPHLFLEVAEQVLADHPDTHFALVGGGPMLGDLRSRAFDSPLRDRVLLPGRVDDLGVYYRAASLFLSTSAYEGFGIALAESLAAGVPVITTDVGGVRDVVTDGATGLVVETARPEVLASHTSALLADELTRRRLGANGRSDALERFSTASMVGAYESLYRSSVDRDLLVTR